MYINSVNYFFAVKMFNHPNNGSLTSQTAQIQRTMACRLQGSNTLMGNVCISGRPYSFYESRNSLGVNPKDRLVSFISISKESTSPESSLNHFLIPLIFSYFTSCRLKN